MKTSIKITHNKLSILEAYDFVKDPSCGGIVQFIGTVRNNTKGKQVKWLDFSGYESMALKEMQKIAEEALKKFPIHKIAMHHALGKMTIGDIPVIIVVSSPHRDAAFKACKFAIDSLKETVPIWKKEHFENGEIWVNAHP